MITTKGSASAPEPHPFDLTERARAIQERTTRGLLSFNAHPPVHLEGELWAVRSSRGGFHRVDLGAEECTCEDFEFFGSEREVACKNVYAAAIAGTLRDTPGALAWPDGAAADLAGEECERCGAVTDLETDDGVMLCEGCAQQGKGRGRPRRGRPRDREPSSTALSFGTSRSRTLTRLSTRAHIYPAPQHVDSPGPIALESPADTPLCWTGAMQPSGYELRRNPLLRTRVNR
jgi:hypothetical protein